MNEPSTQQGSMLVVGTMHPRPLGPLSRSGRFGQKARRVWGILCRAVKKFFRIDGAQWAGAFAFNAFFSLFPLIVLLVTIASSFVDRDRAGKEVIAYMESYVPISGEMQRHVFDTIAGVINAREQAGVVAFLILVWAALQCFTTLICAINRAWGTAVYNWWRLPLKSLGLLGIRPLSEGLRHVERGLRGVWRDHGVAPVDLSLRVRLHLWCLPLRQPVRSTGTADGNHHGPGGRGLAAGAVLPGPRN